MKLIKNHNIIKLIREDNYIKFPGINENEHPYIATRYITPTWDISDDIILNFYVTDFWQTDKLHENKDIEFEIEITINETVKKYTVKIGDNSKNIGKLPIGEYKYLLQAKDKFGRQSHQLYNEFRVINRSERELDIKNNTHIVTSNDLSKFNITINGNIEDLEVAHNTKMGIQEMMNHYGSLGVKKLVLMKGIYIVDVEARWANGVTVQYLENVLCPPKNFILDLNGSTIKQTISTPDQKVGCAIAINNGYDSHVINGTLIGDYGLREFIPKEGHDYVPGEQGGCCMISGSSKYCSFDNLTIQKYCGYTFTVGIDQAGILKPYDYVDGRKHLQEDITFASGYIDNLGELIESTTERTAQFLNLEEYIPYGYFRTGQYLMFLYQPHGDSNIVKYHFYDKDKNYIKSTLGHSYRDINIPEGAFYVRATYIFDKHKNSDGMCMYFMHTPRNCDITNIHFEDTRTCALAPYQGNNLVIDNCKFVRCASERLVPGGEVTPVAIDFEDGWHNMQDYCLQNCEILEPVGTADLVVVGGFDMIFRNNKNWRISSRGYTRGQVYVNNDLSYVNLGMTNHRMSAFTVVDGNLITDRFANGLGTLEDVKLVIENCNYFETSCQFPNDGKTIVRHCNFDWNYKKLEFRSSILGGTYHNCTFKNFVWNAGHVGNLNAYNCHIENMNLEGIQGDFNLYNSTVNGCKIGTYSIDINIKFDNCIVKDFEFDRITWTVCNINYVAINSEFENANRKNILIDTYSYFPSDKIFKIKTANNKYINSTVLANQVVLDNTNIDFSEMQ